MSRNKTVDTPTANQVHGSDAASRDPGRVRRTKHADYQLVPFPQTQRTIAALQRLTKHKHTMHVLTEVDVTPSRQVIQEQKARGEEPLSFTAFIAACLGKAVDEDKAVQAYRKGGNQLVLFEDVDIAIMVEHEVEGHKFPLSYVVRAANHKTAREIHQEIRTFQKLHTAQVLPIPRLVQRWPGPAAARWASAAQIAVLPEKKWRNMRNYSSGDVRQRQWLGHTLCNTPQPLPHSWWHQREARRRGWAHRHPGVPVSDGQSGS